MRSEELHGGPFFDKFRRHHIGKKKNTLLWENTLLGNHLSGHVKNAEQDNYVQVNKIARKKEQNRQIVFWLGSNQVPSYPL